MNDIISIVVPVYNIEEYIARCVESLINQSYSDLEIILVDDGSSDNSYNICKKYTRIDSRVKLFSQDNQGLSGARNTGIEKATGKYLMFVDGDDYLLYDSIEKAYLAISDADICIIQYQYVDDDGKIVRDNDKKAESVCMNGVNAMKELLTDDSLGGVVAWGKLYRRELLIKRDLKFPCGKYHEDCFTTYKFCYWANKVVYIPYDGYMYVQRPGSITHSVFSEKHLDKIQAADECIIFAKNNCPQCIDSCEAAAIRWYLQVANKIMRSKLKRKNDLVIIREKIRKISYLHNDMLSKKYKILALIYESSFFLYKVLLQIFAREEI